MRRRGREESAREEERGREESDREGGKRERVSAAS